MAEQLFDQIKLPETIYIDKTNYRVRYTNLESTFHHWYPHSSEMKGGVQKLHEDERVNYRTESPHSNSYNQLEEITTNLTCQNTRILVVIILA